MIKGITSSGYKYEIEEERLQDWRLLKALAKFKGMSEDDTVEDEQAFEIIEIMGTVEEIIFKDKGKAFEKHILKKNNGIVAPVVALKELFEIIKSHQSTKN